MIISKKNKFVFVKGRKVASTSVEILLSKYCGVDDIITPITPFDELNRIKSGYRCCRNYHKKHFFKRGLAEEKNYIFKLLTADESSIQNINAPRGNYNNHMSLSQIEKNFGRFDENWNVFAIDRNPYDKILSKINIELRFSDYKANGSEMKSSLEELKSYVAKNFDIKNYVKVKNIDLYKDKFGELKTKIIKYENLENELSECLSSLNFDVNLLSHAKKGIGKNKIHPGDVFSQNQIKDINRVFAEEFEIYGYETL